MNPLLSVPRLRCPRAVALVAPLCLPALVIAQASIPAPAPSRPPTATEETVVLSPFEVISVGRGYYSSSTMSGTRLNSRVEDLASSITVVTKEQMADFALLDINDIFLYEAGTEGTGTYTEFSVDRNGSPVDNSLNPNTANRVRGVGPANLSFGNFETSGRMPIDPSIVDAVEISRGPNTTVFGLGNAAGTVNMAPASANLNRNRSQLSFRADSFEGYRAALDLNRVLWRNRLALRVGGTRQHDGYNLKPSGTDTSRLNTMVRYQPFRRTTLTASHFYYHISGNRPNTTPPRDAITGWIKAGQPTWDPPTATARINGVVQPGTFTATTLPPYFTSASLRDQSVLFIDTNGSIGYWGPGRTSSTTTPEGRNQSVVVVNTVPEPIRSTSQPLFSSDPSVTNRDIYDWTRVNLAAMNRINETTLMTHLQLEQIFFDTPRHLLALQAGYFREAGRRDNRGLYGTAGSSGATGFLYIDVNERMVDGSPNPFFLRPYVGFYNSKGISGGPFERETWRGQLAYRLDLRKEKNLLRWLGLQQFVGYGEYKENRSRTTIWRDVILSNHTWYPAPTGVASEFVRLNVALNYYRYYVGDNQGHNADTAPKDFAPGVYPYRWGGWTNPGAANATPNFVTEQARLGPGFWYDSTNTWDRSLLRTTGGVIQSHLLGDRIVTTFGYRKDQRDQRQRGQTLFRSTPDGIILDYDSTFTLSPVDWVHAGGNTSTAGVVAKPFRWLNLHYNQSNSFQPQGYAVGLYLGPLPDPTGQGHDYGLSLNLFSGKLVLRANRYETTQINSRNGSMRIIAQRIRNLDFDSPNSNQFFNLTTRARAWVENAAAAQGRTLTIDQINQEVSRLTRLDVAFFTRPESRDVQNELVAETQDVTARGTEVELNFNPTPHWTTKFNFTHQESIDSKMSPAVTQWIAERMPVWTTVIDPEINRLWWTERYNGTNSPSQYFAASVKAPYDAAVANQGKSRSQIRKFRFNLSSTYRLAGLGLENTHLKRLSLGGALRWECQGGIGYYGLEQLPAIITALDPNRPIYDPARLYADAFVSYRTRLFANKVGATFQFNVRNLQENGRLQPISAYPDGTPNAYRIVDPRQFILSASFDL